MSNVTTKAYNLTQAEVYVIVEALMMFLDEQEYADDYGVLGRIFESIMAEFEFKSTPQVE